MKHDPPCRRRQGRYRRCRCRLASFNKRRTWAIAKPDDSPELALRKGGSPSVHVGIISRSMRRSVMLIRSVNAIAA
jgi:hypothetical protein